MRNGLLFLSSQNIVLGIRGWKMEEVSVQCHLFISCLVTDKFLRKETMLASGIREEMWMSQKTFSQAKTLSSVVI